MFETHDGAEIPVPPVFGEPGLRLWSYVRSRLHVPWLHVVYSLSYEEEGERYSLREMMFLTQVGQLQQLQETGAQIVAIDLMSPGHLNGTDGWKLEALAEIWEGAVPKTEGQVAQVYVLKNGTRYVDSALDTPESELLNKRCVWQLGN